MLMKRYRPSSYVVRKGTLLYTGTGSRANRKAVRAGGASVPVDGRTDGCGLESVLPVCGPSGDRVSALGFGRSASGARLRALGFGQIWGSSKFGQISSKLSTNLARRSRIPKKTFLGKSARGKSPIPILPGPAPQIWGAQYKFGILLVRAPRNRPPH